MKILIINKHWFPQSGADMYTMQLVRELERRGNEVVIFAFDDPDNVTPREHHRFVPSLGSRSIRRRFWSVDSAERLRAFIETEKPDVAHVHGIHKLMSPSILFELKKHEIPIVFTVHDYSLISANSSLYDQQGIDNFGTMRSVVRRRGVNGSLIASFIASKVFRVHDKKGMYTKNIDRMIFTTEYVKRFFRARGWRGDKGMVIPYAVDLEGVDNKPQADDGYIVFVGELDKSSGVHVLLASARQTGLPIKIIGDGPARNNLMAQAGAMTNVDFLGALPRKDALDHMRRARMTVMPSVGLEPFGLVALESQGVGTPVIVSKIGGLSEVIVHGQTGLFVNPDDVQQLAMAMQRLWEDPEEAQHMGQLAKRRFESVYSMDRHVGKLMGVYSELV